MALWTKKRSCDFRLDADYTSDGRDLGLYTYIFQDQEENLLLGNYQEGLECVSKPTVHRTTEKSPFFLEKYVDVSHVLKN